HRTERHRPLRRAPTRHTRRTHTEGGKSWRRRRRTCPQFGHEAVTPENREIAVEDKVKGPRGSREISRQGPARDVDVARRIECEVAAILRIGSPQEGGVDEGRTGGIQLA